VSSCAGADRSFTFKAIIAEAAGIGIVVGLLGLVVGTAIQYLVSIALTNVLGIDVAWDVSPAVVAISLAALLTCLLGAVLPAMRAARLNIVAAISVD
jgi:putative ABC transport system permease protein